MKLYKVILKTSNSAQFIHYADDGVKKYTFIKDKPVFISDEYVVKQLKMQQCYEIKEV